MALELIASEFTLSLVPTTVQFIGLWEHNGVRGYGICIVTPAMLSDDGFWESQQRIMARWFNTKRKNGEINVIH